jgi:large subunit ribosomal protein L24
MHVRTKDTVLVLSGKDKGKRGEVRSVDLAKGRIVVAGVNVVKKHAKPNPKKGHQGGILEQEAPIQVSNVMLVCPKCSEPTRAKASRSGAGGSVRSCRRCDTQMDK